MADNLKSEKILKTTANSDANHAVASDSENSSTGDFECGMCGLGFVDGDAYEKHMQGKKHQKKITETKLKAKNLAVEKKKTDNESDDDSEDLYCEVCDKGFSGYISYMAHIKGSVHAKNIKKKKLKQKLGNVPGVLADSSKDSDGVDLENDDDDGILPKPFATCEHCRKDFYGPESYDMHLKSVKHKKKVKQSQTVRDLKAKYSSENGGEEEFFSKCDVCQTPFSGVVPYKIHMESKVHKKNIERMKIAEEMKKFHIEDSGYVCSECKKSFTDPLAFKYHLEKNNSHEKQKAKNALREFLGEHPEIVFVYPFVDDASENENDNDDGETQNDYYLICKLCNMSFPGPESARDHVKSKKHLSAQKEKKLLKLHREDRKNKTSVTAKTEEKLNSINSKIDSKLSGKDIPTNGSQSKSAEDSHDFEMI